ncbi:hypothetical protein [Deinococcus sp. Marseille-Q6407]|uniref:hypothetical protein n=1 Tax=Deinococcus sp. Marseille-Q6407 TaxID=2969223 RepID=UPI0021BE9ED7|nr:hypothetical protein [Deinococcus sp. Marseille-Q6407]
MTGRVHTAQRPAGHRINRLVLGYLLEAHNEAMGTRYNVHRLGVVRLTLWDGSELMQDGQTWFLRPAPQAAAVAVAS